MALILSSTFIGINNIFSGLIVRPQQMTGLWAITYWLNPGKGLCMSMYRNDNIMVIVESRSDFLVGACVCGGVTRGGGGMLWGTMTCEARQGERIHAR